VSRLEEGNKVMTTVSQILSLKGGDVVTGDQSMSLGQAVARLSDHRIGALIFVDENATVIGILSERDIVRALALHGARVLEELASAHMTRKVRTCTRDDTVEDLMDMMTSGKFRHLPVLDGDSIVGLVSIGDVVKWRLREFESEQQALHDYIKSA